jgi:hypothetical protein
MSVLDDELIEAYKLTDFHVKSSPPFILNVGLKSNELIDMFKQHRVSSAAFITAWNPYSESLTDAQNYDRNLKLFSDISNKCYIALDGFGQDPIGKWAGEESFLIIGIDLDSSKALGYSYQQNAIIWCDSDAIPQLVLLR